MWPPQRHRARHRLPLHTSSPPARVVSPCVVSPCVYVRACVRIVVSSVCVWCRARGQVRACASSSSSLGMRVCTHRVDNDALCAHTLSSSRVGVRACVYAQRHSTTTRRVACVRVVTSPDSPCACRLPVGARHRCVHPCAVSSLRASVRVVIV